MTDPRHDRPPATEIRMHAITARLTAAGLDAAVHETRGVLDIEATWHQDGRKDTTVIVDEDGYVELTWWNPPDATPAQVTAAITAALAAIRPSP
jgi:hypothetical protein